MLLYSENCYFNSLLYNQVELEKLILFNFLGWHVFKVGSRKLVFLILSPIAVLLYKYQFMIACTENIQSIVGSVVIFPRSGVIHWPTHPYIIPCFTGHSVKGSSRDAAQSSLGYLPSEIDLPSACQSWAAHGGLWYISGCVYLLLECGNRKRQILSLEENLFLLMKLSVIHLKGYLAHVFTKYLFETVAALKLRKGALCCHLSVNWGERELYVQTFGPIYLPAFFLMCISIDFLRNQQKLGGSEKWNNFILFFMLEKIRMVLKYYLVWSYHNWISVLSGLANVT